MDTELTKFFRKLKEKIERNTAGLHRKFVG